MTFPFKIVVSSLAVAGFGGASLVGSNYLFTKNKLVNIAQNETKDWNEKLPKLAKKLKLDTQLAAKIDSTSGQTKLAFATSTSDSKEFKNKEQAIEALKAWCFKEDVEKKELKEDLCKKTIEEGWLFGNRV